MRRLITGAALAGTAFLGSAASAHDFFLLPERFTTPTGGSAVIQATVGSYFPTPEIAVTADRVERVSAIGPGRPLVRIAGVGEKALNLELTGARAGLVAVGVTARPRDVDYGEDRIPLILGEYRVSREAAAAVEALPRPRTWQVASRRFAKTLVCVRRCTSRSAAAKAFGAHLEFVGTSSDRRFRLLARGRPLANYPVDLVGADRKRHHLATDGRGEVRVPASMSGATMLFAAKLEPPAGQQRFILDLTSLTFSRP